MHLSRLACHNHIEVLLLRFERLEHLGTQHFMQYMSQAQSWGNCSRQTLNPPSKCSAANERGVTANSSTASSSTGDSGERRILA